MKKVNLIKQLSIFILCVCSLTVYGQSISGNVGSKTRSMESDSRDLGYANVDIYRNDSLVANVLADKNGDFKVDLDKGNYRCEIKYAGYETVVQNITVKSDEKSDFTMTEDEGSKYSAKKMASYEEAFTERSYSSFESVLTSNMWGKSKKKDTEKKGKLTAGEINDFSKWNLWNELTKSELSSKQEYWNFSPTERYSLQLTNQDGLPLANAKVELIEKGKTIYTSRTDNTGKAELWGNLQHENSSKIKGASIHINYNGLITSVDKAKTISKGINTLVLNTEYIKSQNVDIAIVVDATGSMQDEIDYLKFDINDVIFQAKEFSSSLNLRFANVFFRDEGDAYLTESQDFTRVLSESIAYTNEHNADGGGDHPEAVDVALEVAINNLSWNDETRTKILFLVLDAPPHSTPEVQEKMRTLSKQAAEKGIRIVPIVGSGADKYTEYIMRCVALATNGTYTFLTDCSSIGDSHIKPSTNEYQTEVLNDLLVRIIKSYTYMPDNEQIIADLGVNLPDSLVVIPSDIDTTNTENPTETTVIDDVVELHWNYYPNPTTGIINIVANKEIEQLYISDLSGKVIQVIENIEPDEAVRADLSNYASGIYLIRYPMGKQWISGKIMLVR